MEIWSEREHGEDARHARSAVRGGEISRGMRRRGGENVGGGVQSAGKKGARIGRQHARSQH